MRISGRQIRERGGYRLLFLLPVALVLFAASVFAQERGAASASLALSEFPGPASLEQQGPPEGPQPGQSGTSSDSGNPQPSAKKAGGAATSRVKPQPKRILGIMPNFHAVGAGMTPPPPAPKQAFVIATRNSFDYSAFLFLGMTSVMAEGANTHAQLGKGLPGFGRYYWRGFVDKTDGNYLVTFALPTVLHQDERYFTLGKGGILKRVAYATSRIAITPNYQGHPSFNTSELLGRGIAQGISLGYYPSHTRTLEGIASKYGFAIARDAFTNVLREFWPDVATHVLHSHP
jgi:hypothetical protein